MKLSDIISVRRGMQALSVISFCMLSLPAANAQFVLPDAPEAVLTVSLDVDADRDNDGIPNTVELASTLDPDNAADATRDLDGDGWRNIDEYRLGTGINNPASTPLGQSDPHQKVFAIDGAAVDFFGQSVAIDGDTTLIGASRDDDNGVDSGSVYVFVRAGGIWTQQTKLSADDSRSGDNFGFSLALHGDTALVGAPADSNISTGPGSAYVFIRIGEIWQQQAKLNTVDEAATTYFGYSVALAGDTALVGDFANDNGAGQIGAAYVFTRSSEIWSQQAKLNAADVASGGGYFFGASTALSGDTALIGAPQDSDKGNNAGAAYVFSRSNTIWTQQAKLTAADGAANDFFSSSLTLNGDTALIGAFRGDGNAVDSGAAYVFTRVPSSLDLGSWLQVSKLIADDGAADDFFGNSVALSGDKALVGAYAADDTDHNASGAAYLFTRTDDSWTLAQRIKLSAADSTTSSLLGWSVALAGDTALIGARSESHIGSNAGAAYFFDPSLDFDNDGLSHAAELALGTNPSNADSDGDGIRDGDELNTYNTNPLAADSDGDGLGDGIEVGLPGYDADPSTTTDPNNADSDDDGYLDGNNGKDPCEDCNNNGRIDNNESDPFTAEAIVRLRQGWGLFSYPAEVPSEAATCLGLAVALGGFDNIESIARHNPLSGNFEQCDVNGGADFPIVLGEAYVVQTLSGVSMQWPLSPSICPARSLERGVNFVGHPSPADLTCYDWLEQQPPGSVSSIQRYNANSTRFETCALSDAGGTAAHAVGSNFRIRAAQGYLFNATTNEAVVYPGCP